jgi:hypothetical protein
VNPAKPDKATVREPAVKACVDPRTILKVYAGQPVRGMPARRARAVLEAEGLVRPEPTDPEAA